MNKRDCNEVYLLQRIAYSLFEVKDQMILNKRNIYLN